MAYTSRWAALCAIVLVQCVSKTLCVRFNTGYQPGWLQAFRPTPPSTGTVTSDGARATQFRYYEPPTKTIVQSFVTVQRAQPLAGPTTVGRWRTPHPDPDTRVGPTTGLSGAIAIAMQYNRDGTVIFTERPHGNYSYGNANPLIVNGTTGVGQLASLYTVSYINNNPSVTASKQDTFVALNAQSQPFCVGVTIDSLGNSINVGGDNQCIGCLYRSQADKNANIPYPDGFHDVRRFVPGGTSMSVVARMFDRNSVTGQPNTARQCCIQLPTDTVPIFPDCSPDPNCSPRWYPTLLSLPSSNVMIVGGGKNTGSDPNPFAQNPTWQILNVSNYQLTYNQNFPSNILTQQLPYALYPHLWVLPNTATVIMFDGVKVQFFAMTGDAITSQDVRYGIVPDLAYPTTFILMATIVMLSLEAPNYTPELLVMGGSTYDYNGLSYSMRLSNIGPGLNAQWTQEDMLHPRIQGAGVVLPDGKVFLCNGAGAGSAGGTFNAGNTYTDFQTAPQIYDPKAPAGSRWSDYLEDSGIARGYHSGALLIASGEVLVGGSEPTGEYRVQYYAPAYLNSTLPKPVITTVPATIGYGGTFTVAYTLAQPANISRVVIVRLGGSTHAVQMDQRTVVLTTKVVSRTSLTVTAPPDGTVAIPGYYMLFLVTTSDIPSVAKFVQVKGAYTPKPPAPFPVNDVILGGQSLAQGALLYSASRQYFFTLQADGNLVVYDTALYQQFGPTDQAAVRASGTYGKSNNTPFRFTMQLDCNAVLYDSTNAPLYATNTYNQGTSPCRFQMRNDGSFAVIDALNITLSVNGAPIQPNPNSGVMTAQQQLLQVSQLFSTDQRVFLTVQTDGNIVLYNTTLYNQLGANRPAAIWASETFGSTPQPFSLVMQEDCNLVLYNGNFPASGPNPGVAVFSSNTYNQGSPFCKLVVSSANGGSISILGGNNVAVYTRP